MTTDRPRLAERFSWTRVKEELFRRVWRWSCGRLAHGLKDAAARLDHWLLDDDPEFRARFARPAFAMVLYILRVESVGLRATLADPWWFPCGMDHELRAVVREPWAGDLVEACNCCIPESGAQVRAEEGCR
ncbi:hypothetical protein [Nannocystis exedens]|uniref:hypothetical protein n=1 Tax=Nannocystis exedens TaxID=54 RepID=UPI000BBA0574|nr:hypothetical protein [Nannocystis exedens]PCC66470.1 hypothetical protein NAEX_09058 [Nannocystis exedens]